MTRAYSAYRDSGVEWLGDVPAHWTQTPIKHVVNFVNGCAFKPTEWSEEGTPIIRIENLNGSMSFNCFEGAVNPRHHVSQGDILFGWSGNRGTSFGPFIWPHSGQFFLNQHIFRVTEFNCDAGWLYWSLKALTFYVEEQAHGIIGMVHITKGKLGEIAVSLPPLPEQRAIAGFLDLEVGKIDALVEEQRRLIALLAEKRRAVISHAVTRGLNPAAPLKPSGVDWLGDIPAHWEVGALRHFAKLQGGFAFAADLFGTEGTPVVRMTNLDRGVLNLSEVMRIPEVNGNERVALRDGDLLWGMSGSVGETGSLGNFARVSSADLPCQLNQRVGRFIPLADSLSCDFIEKIIQSRYFAEQILLWVTGTAQFNISSPQVEACMVTVPPVDEQAAIVARLDAQTARFNALSAEADRAVALLLERRAALISAAVTGKIDVRALES
jgi:type I restriction enzyme S subunit